jgi:phosphinothricin acetyltransferase
MTNGMDGAHLGDDGPATNQATNQAPNKRAAPGPANPATNPGAAPAATIRPCVPDDLAAIARIYGHYVRTSIATFELEPPAVDYWQDRLDEIGGLGLPFHVAAVGGKVVGYAFCSRWRPRPAYRQTVEDSIYLAPDAVGQGIGTALLGAVLTECRAAGMREVIAVISTERDSGGGASQALHERHGFRLAGRLVAVGFKYGRWLDTIVMQRSVGEAAG